MRRWISIWILRQPPPAAGTVERGWSATIPDAIIGWNPVVRLRVLQKHAERYQIPLRLGRRQPAGVARARLQTEPLFAAAGRRIIDGIEALKSATEFSFLQPEYVSQALLGEGKRSTTLYQRMADRPTFAEDKPARPATT